MSNELEQVVADVNSEVTVANLSSQIPNVGSVLAVFIIFGVGFVIMRRVLRGAQKGKARI